MRLKSASIVQGRFNPHRAHGSGPLDALGHSKENQPLYSGTRWQPNSPRPPQFCRGVSCSSSSEMDDPLSSLRDTLTETGRYIQLVNSNFRRINVIGYSSIPLRSVEQPLPLWRGADDLTNARSRSCKLGLPSSGLPGRLGSLGPRY